MPPPSLTDSDKTTSTTKVKPTKRSRPDTFIDSSKASPALDFVKKEIPLAVVTRAKRSRTGTSIETVETVKQEKYLPSVSQSARGKQSTRIDNSKIRIAQDPLQTKMPQPNAQFKYYCFGKKENADRYRVIHSLFFTSRNIPGTFCEPAETEFNESEIGSFVNGPNFRGAYFDDDLWPFVMKFIPSIGGSLHPLAKLAPFVDVVVKSSSGHVRGYNSFVNAFRDILVERKIKFGKNIVNAILVLGTCSVARCAIVAALAVEGNYRVSLIGETADVENPLIEQFSLYPFSETEKYSLIICCIAGDAQNIVMKKYPKMFREYVAPEKYPYVFDFCYNVRQTPLVTWARPGLTSDQDRTDLLHFAVALILATHRVWTHSLIIDGEINETAITRRDVDVIPLGGQRVV